MITFCAGLLILLTGAAIYGRICEKALKPTDRKTPANARYDGVDFVPMNKRKNSLIELLNIAGTGPILGPIQGALFGPVAFITIPIGCVLGGAFHDYMIGMISVRNEGKQMPGLIHQFLGKHMYAIYNVFVCFLLLLASAVFIYAPGDLFTIHIAKSESSVKNPVMWIVYGVIFIYCILAALLPIDKIIGKVYPIFGLILLLSSVGVLSGLFIKGYKLDEIWDTGVNFVNPYGEKFIPIFFVTVACGIVSGFHSPQATLVSRTMNDEHDGRMVFYNMMILEGFIAMVWAAAAMGAVNMGITDNDALHNAPTSVVGIVAKDMLGEIGGLIAITGVIILPVTSGDTALRSMRIMIADALHIDTTKKKNSLLIAAPIFICLAAILIFAKANARGFNILWRYFSWENESIAVFSFTMISVYMIKNQMPYLMALIPGTFYMYVVSSYILSAKIGFRLPWTVAYITAAFIAFAFAAGLISFARKQSGQLKKASQTS